MYEPMIMGQSGFVCLCYKEEPQRGPVIFTEPFHPFRQFDAHRRMSLNELLIRRQRFKGCASLGQPLTSHHEHAIMLIWTQGKRRKPCPRRCGNLGLGSPRPRPCAIAQTGGAPPAGNGHLDRHRRAQSSISRIGQRVRRGPMSGMAFLPPGGVTAPRDVPADDTRPNGLCASVEGVPRERQHVTEVMTSHLCVPGVTCA